MLLRIYTFGCVTPITQEYLSSHREECKHHYQQKQILWYYINFFSNNWVDMLLDHVNKIAISKGQVVSVCPLFTTTFFTSIIPRFYDNVFVRRTTANPRQELTSNNAIWVFLTFATWHADSLGDKYLNINSWGDHQKP